MNKLGFGFLRLPQKAGKNIDWPLLEVMVDEFLAGGGTYFDTAYTYLDGMSEAALKRTVVERHPRTSFQIADKLPESQNGHIEKYRHSMHRMPLLRERLSERNCYSQLLPHL